MKPLSILILCAISIAGAASTASAAGTKDAIDEIVVVGRKDRAMNAFMRGDFVTAEKEFKENWRCVRRDKMLLDFALEAATMDAGQAVLYNMPVIFNTQLRKEEIPERTCVSPEWQLYMIGLSQIQMGRFADAKKTLYRVTGMSRPLVLFDADYRVGLLELLDGNIDSAERQLTRLDKMRRTCDRRGRGCEVHADLDASIAYLRKSIDDARQGQLRL